MKIKLALLVFLILPFSEVAFSSEGTIYVFRPADTAFKEIASSIEDDISEEIDVVTIEVDKNFNPSSFKKRIETVKPNAIVLLGNSTLNHYIQYQKENPNTNFPPAIATAALFVDKLIPKLKNTSAIRYEIPAVTSIVNMRNVLKKPVKKVGILYREGLRSVIDEYEVYCKEEGIELVRAELPNVNKKVEKKISKSLKTLLKSDVDAFLVLNDNALLTSAGFSKGWKPTIGSKNIPIIVGIDALSKPQLNFGSFSFVPDNSGLGMQAASLIWDLLDNDWEFDADKIQEPLSVKKTINRIVLDKKKIPYSKDRLGSFDKVISD